MSAGGIEFYRWHYNDVIMSAIASLITSLTVVYSTDYSGADQRKQQSSASLAFVRGIQRWRVNSPHKGPVTGKMFPFDDLIMEKTNQYNKETVGSTTALESCLFAVLCPCSHSLVIMLAADGLVPIWHQGISRHHQSWWRGLVGVYQEYSTIKWDIWRPSFSIRV